MILIFIYINFGEYNNLRDYTPNNLITNITNNTKSNILLFIIYINNT